MGGSALTPNTTTPTLTPERPTQSLRPENTADLYDNLTRPLIRQLIDAIEKGDIRYSPKGGIDKYLEKLSENEKIPDDERARKKGVIVKAINEVLGDKTTASSSSDTLQNYQEIWRDIRTQTQDIRKKKKIRPPETGGGAISGLDDWANFM